MKKLVRQLGKENNNALRLIRAGRIFVGWGCTLKADGAWLQAIPGVGPKIGNVMFHVVKKPGQPDCGIPADIHVFAIARASRWVNDGDVEAHLVAQSLEQWVPRDRWCKMNIVLAGLGQVLVRGAVDDAQCLVDQLLAAP